MPVNEFDHLRESFKSEGKLSVAYKGESQFACLGCGFLETVPV
jgi:hypothetical protein